MPKTARTKTKKILVGTVAYSMRDLKQSLKAANDEAQGYLDQLQPLRERVGRLEGEAANWTRIRRMILELLGVDTSERR